MQARLIEAVLETDTDYVLQIHSGKINLSITDDPETIIRCGTISDLSSDECTLDFQTSSDVDLWVDLTRKQTEDLLAKIVEALITQGGHCEEADRTRAMKEDLLTRLHVFHQMPDSEDED